MKGATGTQASFLEIFEGDEKKVLALDNLVTKAMGFQESYAVTGQTYPRIVDYQVLSTLDTLGVALNEIVGQKTDALKKDFEILSNYLHNNAMKAAEMASVQWLERSLDDSSERRIIISESFYIADIMINKLLNYNQKIHFDNFEAEYVLDKVTKIQNKALQVIENKAASTIKRLESLSEQHKWDPCVAYTHGQFAQPETHGKRLSVLNYNYVLALNDLKNTIDDLKYIEFSSVRNSIIQSRLNQFAIASSKMALDIRLLQHDLELNEPFGLYQVGSSAMPYKKNPMTAERINGLSRNKIITTKGELLQDDFYNTDAILDLSLAVLAPDIDKKKGFTVHTQKSLETLNKFMPFLAAENMMMQETVHDNKDRNKVHEDIRGCMLKARESMDAGGENNMLELLVKKGFKIDLNNKELLEPTKYIGLSVSQVTNFNANIVQPILKEYKSVSNIESEVKV
jgi:adenylosuccinate lyase